MSETLTGNRRHRVECRLWGGPRLVLQVEVIERGFECVGPFVEPYSTKGWRDARPEDVTVESLA